MNERYDALETLLMLRQGAWLNTEYSVSAMSFTIEYGEGTRSKFVAGARTWAAAMDKAETQAAGYIAKITG